MADNSQKGTASVEMALGMLVLTPMLLLLIEGVFALNEYLTLRDASYQAARMVVRDEGDASGVDQLVQDLSQGVSGDAPTVDVQLDASDPDHKTVTVKVDHEYEPYFLPTSDGQGGQTWGVFDQADLQFTASTTMPLP